MDGWVDKIRQLYLSMVVTSKFEYFANSIFLCKPCVHALTKFYKLQKF